MTQNDEIPVYPGLFTVYDRSALINQRMYHRSTLWSIMALALSSFTYYFGTQSDCYIIASLLFFLTFIIITVVSKVNQYESSWYQYRAISESIKTRYWRFVMRTEPYDKGNLNEMSKKFVTDISSIIRESIDLQLKLKQKTDECLINESMQKIFNKPYRERLMIYSKHRITNQHEWYQNKALYNEKKKNIFYWVLWICQALALVLIVGRLVTGPIFNYPVDSVSLVACMIITWMEAKRFNDLSISYKKTYKEIEIIKGRETTIRSEVELRDFIIDSENAFSREHTLWIAKRHN